MHRKNCSEENYCHRYACKCYESPNQHRKAPQKFDANICPCHYFGSWDSNSMKYRRKMFRTSSELCVAMSHEAIPDDEPQRLRTPMVKSCGDSCRHC